MSENSLNKNYAKFKVDYSNELAINEADSLKQPLLSRDLDIIDEENKEADGLYDNFDIASLSEQINVSGFSELTVDLERKSTIGTIIDVAISSTPICFNLLFVFLMEVVNIMLIGSFNDPILLTAVGLSTFYTNLSAIIPLQGWPGAMDTLCSTAFGAKQYKLVGIYTTICRFSILAFIIAISIPLSFVSERFYLLLGQPQEIASLSSRFNIYLIPMYFFQCQYTVMTRYLQCTKVFNAGMYASFVSCILHPIWAWFLIIHLDLKLDGAALSLCITQMTNCIFIWIYTKLSDQINRESLFYFCKETFEVFYIRKFLDLAIPSVILILVESFTFEIMIIIASFLGPDQMSANVCLYNFSLIGYMISNGIGIAAGTYVGNSVGKLNANLAYKYFKAIMYYAYIVTIAITTIINIYRSEIAALYTKNDKITEIFLGLFPYFSWNLIFDMPGVVIGGINKGLGRQKTTVKIWFIIQYLFGIPLMIIMTFYFDQQIYGLWKAQMFNIILIFFGVYYVFRSKSIEDTIEEFKRDLEEHKQRQKDRTNSQNEKDEAIKNLLINKKYSDINKLS